MSTEPTPERERDDKPADSLTAHHVATLIVWVRRADRRSAFTETVTLWSRGVWTVVQWLAVKGLPTGVLIFLIVLAYRNGGVSGLVELLKP